MKVCIKRIDKSLPLPEYKTAGAVAFDLASRIDMTILPKSIAYIPLNVALEPPEGHMVLLAARSSLHKKGLMLANGVGIVDRDFSGNEDEYHAAVYNFSDNPVNISRGDRVAQAVFKPYEKAEWHEVDDLENKSRGGFGTTDIN
ncbi:MAG: dUTP diphosphatase [Patescibacteria group bacterium]